MKKIIAIILISFFILGCSTKKKLINKSKEETKETSISKTETVQKESEIKDTTVKQEEIKTVIKKEENKSVEIKGKADEKTPLTYYNVVNGDTIDLFKVVGNAEVIFKSSNNNQNSSYNSNLTNNTKESNSSEKTISNAVENVKQAVKEVQTKSVDVVKKGFTFGTYLTFFLWGLAIIVIAVIILWFRKTTFWTEILTKVKKYIK